MKLFFPVGFAGLWLVIGTWFSPAPTALFAAEATVLQTADMAICEYSTAAGTLILEYDVTFGEYANSDLQPRLQVFGNGRVRVHYPRFMKNSGDYERWLSRADLDALIDSMITKGVLDFDEREIQAAKKECVSKGRFDAQVEGQVMVATYRADGDVTTFGVFLDRYVPANRSLPVRHNLAKRISWRSLAFDAQMHPQITAISRLAAFAEELSALTEHKGLERLGH